MNLDLQGMRMKPMPAFTFGDLELDMAMNSLTGKLHRSNREYVRSNFVGSLMITVDVRTCAGSCSTVGKTRIKARL